MEDRSKKTWVANFRGSLFLSLAMILSSGCGDGGGNGHGSATPTRTTMPGAPTATPTRTPTTLDIAVCAPENGPFSLTIDNPYFPLVVGQVSVLDGTEDGAAVHLEITVLDETEVIAGVTTRVVEERQSEDGELVELARNFFVQAPDGTVCYYGEDVDVYDNGVVTDHDSQWRSGIGANLPGIIMPAHPAVGVQYDQESAPGVAQDHAEIIAVGESVDVPAGTFPNSIRTKETSPLEPDVTEFKAYAPGVGNIIDAALELTSH